MQNRFRPSRRVDRTERANNMASEETPNNANADALVQSPDPLHPANHICELCRKFYALGWVTGTGGGVSIKHGAHIYIAPSGVQKELMQPDNMFVMDYESQQYLRQPMVGIFPHCETSDFVATAR